MHSFRLFGAGAFALLIMTMPALAQGSLPQQPMLEIDLVFGRISGRTGVTEQQWADFVAAEITPHFPQGLTINDAVGQWRDPDKNTIVKNVTIVVLQRTGRAEDRGIVAAYKQRFSSNRSACDACGLRVVLTAFITATC
jgi:hypothetical protein